MSGSERRRPDVTTVEFVGAREPLAVGIHEPDPRWAQVFLAHRDRIRSALGSTAVLVEHIGSTSVPGLAAKPIVDVVVAVPDITAEEDYLPPLLAVGYVLRVREPGHRLVRTPERDLHVHIYEIGDPAIEAYLLLRDRLRSDDADRTLYERTKRELMRRDWSSMDAYAEAKTEVIQAILERGRISARAQAPDADGRPATA